MDRLCRAAEADYSGAVAALERHGQLAVNETIGASLLVVNSATIDSLLSEVPLVDVFANPCCAAPRDSALGALNTRPLTQREAEAIIPFARFRAGTGTGTSRPPRSGLAKRVSFETGAMALPAAVIRLARRLRVGAFPRAQ